MPDKKHFVYSARTTEKGLALLNKTKGEMGWDQFVNKAVAAHYGLELSAITLPPSTYQVELEAKRKAKAEAKAAKDALKKANDAEKAKEKKAREKAKADKAKKARAETVPPVDTPEHAEHVATKPAQEEAPADSQAEG